jgi:hypothetical protein
MKNATNASPVDKVEGSRKVVLISPDFVAEIEKSGACE